MKTININLYIPKVEDYWYKEKLQNDPKTMSYNSGYNVSYNGYHYDTGCIDFPKEEWIESYNRRIKNNEFLAYIIDNNINEFIGYVNYQYNKKNNRYECGILIEDKYRGKGYAKESLKLLLNYAKGKGIKEIYDSFEITRVNALNLFLSLGFKIVKKFKIKKFNIEEPCVLLKKNL